MHKLVKMVWSLVLILAMFAVGLLLADKHTLSTQLIRLRVVGASDQEDDQKIKLQVRDAINEYLQTNMPSQINVDGAKAFLTENIAALTEVAANKLASLGEDGDVRVYLCREAAQVRRYETFSLPSGVYETLRVDIGKAEGSNWWCVVFPALCTPVSADVFHQTAVSGGMNEGLTNTLTECKGYRVRFFLLDCLGKLENILYP